MFYGYYKNFSYEDFKQYLLDKNYNDLINNCYYSPNKDDIFGYLETHLQLNNFIINYVYVRNHYQYGNFKNKDYVGYAQMSYEKKCLWTAPKLNRIMQFDNSDTHTFMGTGRGCYSVADTRLASSCLIPKGILEIENNHK